MWQRSRVGTEPRPPTSTTPPVARLRSGEHYAGPLPEYGRPVSMVIPPTLHLGP